MRYVIRGDLVGLHKAIRVRKQILGVRKEQAVMFCL